MTHEPPAPSARRPRFRSCGTGFRRILSSGLIPVAAGVRTSFLSKAESRGFVWTASCSSLTHQWSPGLLPTGSAVVVDAAVTVSMQIACSSGAAGSHGNWGNKPSVSALEGTLWHFTCLPVSRGASPSVVEPPGLGCSEQNIFFSKSSSSRGRQARPHLSERVLRNPSSFLLSLGAQRGASHTGHHGPPTQARGLTAHRASSFQEATWLNQPTELGISSRRREGMNHEITHAL